MHVGLLGCGYTGERLLAQLVDKAYHATAFTRSSERVSALETRFPGRIQRLDLDNGEALSLPECDTLIYMVPPPRLGREDARSHRLLEQLSAERLRHCILLSATGVYGDCEGRWIDEKEPLKPHADRSHRRVDAERQWRHWCQTHEVGLSILRVSGIYGPGRLPQKRLSSGEAILRPADSPYSNRIHVDDLVETVVALIQRGPQGVVNVADDAPSTMYDYFTAVCQVLGLSAPPEIDWTQAQAQLSEGMLSYLVESRRLNNAKLKCLLGKPLRFPSIQEGLPACVEEMASARH